MKVPLTIIAPLVIGMLGACSSANGIEDGVDASKLDAEMEKRADEIEARAAAAAAQVEREAAAELTRIENAARAADAESDNDGDSER